MPPLILHNVPDEELYVGEDGVQRPYAMLFPGTEGNPSASRVQRTVPETGSFGKSTRRSRSRTGTPAPAKREDPTLVAADAIFSAYLSTKATVPPESSQRISSLSASISQPNLASATALTPIDGNASPSTRYVHKEPTEVILRGYKSSHQYAALKQYEQIAGRICEDYPRDPPLDQRRYKADLRDPASLRRRAMTAEEKSKALKFAGGNHWIKITFESAEAAESAIFASPQTILGHLVYAELYRGIPPTADEAVPANISDRTVKRDKPTSQTLSPSSTSFRPRVDSRSSSTLPRSFTTPSMSQIGRGTNSFSPESTSSSHTLDSATLSTVTASSATVTEPTQTGQEQEQESAYCRKIPTARRMQLLPAEQALLPQQSYSQQLMSKIPLINWFSSDFIGNQVPKTESGEFDWAKASLYWKFMMWLDSITGWLDIAGNDKDD